MSHILFADELGEVRISGRERARMGIYLPNMALAVFDPQTCPEAWAKLLVPGTLDAYPVGSWQWVEQFRTMWIVGRPAFRYDGQILDTFDLQLNTACVIGSAELRVAAWIHGQSEVHGYVEGEHRGWLAARVETGVEVGLFRRDPFGYDGWLALAKFLRDGSGPVVMSYSVCDYFPAPPPGLAEDECEVWHTMPGDAQWADGLDRLRGGEGNVGALDPATIASRRYGDGRSLFDLLEY